MGIIGLSALRKSFKKAWPKGEETERTAQIGLCTLAIHSPYRKRALRLLEDQPSLPWTVLTDKPSDFSGTSAQALYHEATGPMAIDYIQKLIPNGNSNGAAAYHDKRFVLQAARRRHRTAIFLDADARLQGEITMGAFSPGLAVTPFVQRSIREHLEVCGTWRLPHFLELVAHLHQNPNILDTARWCHETCIALTEHPRESIFFDAWDTCAEFLQQREVYSGEGGVIGLCAAIAGWEIDYESLQGFDAFLKHESGGPKEN